MWSNKILNKILPVQIDSFALEVQIDSFALEVQIDSFALEVQIDSFALEVQIDSFALDWCNSLFWNFLYLTQFQDRSALF